MGFFGIESTSTASHPSQTQRRMGHPQGLRLNLGVNCSRVRYRANAKIGRVLRNKGAQARVPVPLKGKFKRAGRMPALQGKRLTTRMDAMRNFVRGHLLSCLGVPPACAKATARHGRNGRRRWAGWERGTRLR